MHAICEIIIPPGFDVVRSVGQIMGHFCINEDTGETRSHADWWDFWVIGGRFSGAKQEARIDPEQLQRFERTLIERQVTVHSIRCGKPELHPATQIPMVDALWREMVPGHGEQCILFRHSRDQYRQDGYYPDDISTVAQLPERHKAERIIVARVAHDDAARLIPDRMLVQSFYNGISWQDTNYNGNVRAGLALLADCGHRSFTVPGDYLAITVDYHN